MHSLRSDDRQPAKAILKRPRGRFRRASEAAEESHRLWPPAARVAHHQRDELVALPICKDRRCVLPRLRILMLVRRQAGERRLTGVRVRAFGDSISIDIPVD